MLELFYRFVAHNFSFIDPERVAVTGVSYGGYVAGLMLADPVKDVLACGVAVTPVVDWRFYGKLSNNSVQWRWAWASWP